MDHTANTHLPIKQQEALWARDALAVQNACNLSGVAYSLHNLCSAMYENSLSTDEVNTHPAVRLFVCKLADLAGLQYHFDRAAADAAEEMAGARVAP